MSALPRYRGKPQGPRGRPGPVGSPIASQVPYDGSQDSTSVKDHLDDLRTDVDGTIHTLATTSLAETTTIRGNRFSTLGYEAVGDGGACTWKYVASEPAHLAKLQDAAGRWFEPIPGVKGVNIAALSPAYDRYSGFVVALSMLNDGNRISDIECNPTDVLDVTAPFVTRDKHIRVWANGATFIQNTPGCVFELRGSWSTGLPIGAIATAGASVIHVDGSDEFPDWGPGNTIKIVSEDTLPIFPSNAKRGEVATVLYTDPEARNVYLSSPLRGVYTTTPRVGRLNKYDIIVDRAVFDYMPGYTSPADWNPRPYIEISAALNPEIRSPIVKMGYGIALRYYGAVGGVIENAVIEGVYDGASGQDDPDITGYLGYGIQFNYCETSHVRGGFFYRCRHGVDISATGSTEQTLNLTYYGSSRGNTASGATARGCVNAGFNTHHGTEDNTFSDCHTHGGLNAGFTLRGVNNICDETCTSNSDARGFQALVQSGYVGSAVTKRSKWLGKIFDPINWAVIVDTGADETTIGGRVEVSRPRASAYPLYETRGVSNFTTNVHFVNHVTDIQSSIDATLMTYVNDALETVAAPCLVGLDSGGFIRFDASDWKLFCRGMSGMNTSPLVRNTLQNGTSAPSIVIDDLNLIVAGSSSSFGSIIAGTYNAASNLRRMSIPSVAEIVAGATDLSLGNLLSGPIYRNSAARPIGRLVGGMPLTAIINPSTLVTGATETTTVTMTGVITTDRIEVDLGADDDQGLIVKARVSAADTVTVRFTNPLTTTINLFSVTVNLRAYRA